MQAITQYIVDFVDAAGGKTTYPELHEASSYEQRQQLRNGIKEAKALGLIRQEMFLDPETNQLSHNLEKVG